MFYKNEQQFKCKVKEEKLVASYADSFIASTSCFIHRLIYCIGSLSRVITSQKQDRRFSGHFFRYIYLSTLCIMCLKFLLFLSVEAFYWHQVFSVHLKVLIQTSKQSRNKLNSEYAIKPVQVQHIYVRIVWSDDSDFKHKCRYRYGTSKNSGRSACSEKTWSVKLIYFLSFSFPFMLCKLLICTTIQNLMGLQRRGETEFLRWPRLKIFRHKMIIHLHHSVSRSYLVSRIK